MHLYEITDLLFREINLLFDGECIYYSIWIEITGYNDAQHIAFISLIFLAKRVKF